MQTTSASTTQFDLYQLVTDRIIALLEQGTVPWRKPWSSLGPPMNAVSKRPYQGINLWMLLTLPYESNLYLTWAQLKKLNGSVNRGETGHIVMYWQLPPSSTEPHTDELQQRLSPLLRYHKVFNVEQCTGLPSSLHVSDAIRRIDTIAVCEEIVSGMPNPPCILKDRRKAYYDVHADCIGMPSAKHFESAESYYTTLYHELAHSTGHQGRLNRPTMTEMAEFGSEPYSIEELIAELGTCYLAAHTNILEKEVQNSAAYIDGWLSKLQGDKRFIIRASTQAQRAVDYILNYKEEAAA